MEHHKRPAASGMHVVKRYTIDGNETVLDAYDIQGKSLGEVGAHCSRKRAWYAYLGKGKMIVGPLANSHCLTSTNAEDPFVLPDIRQRALALMELNGQDALCQRVLHEPLDGSS